MKIGVFFDLDGTLWDAVDNITHSWNVELAKKGYDITLTSKQLETQMGKLMEDIADTIFPDIPKEKRYDVLNDCMDYEMDYLAENGANIYDGVVDVLKQLSEKYFVSIISNGQKDYVKNFIDYYDLWNYVSDYEEAGRSGMDKEHNITLVKERNNLEQIFYVGDILADMVSAETAGATFIHAAYGFGSVPDDRAKIDDIRELPKLLEEIS